MGYTHYFEALQPDEYLAEAAQELVEASNVSIKGWDGKCEPKFTADLIDLNGDADLGEDYEIFRLERGDLDFNFTKTGRRPYDEVVSAILIWCILNEAEGWENIGSDGDYDDWAGSGAFELYESVFGPLSDDDMARLGETLNWS